jgi:hypothetical protein
MIEYSLSNMDFQARDLAVKMINTRNPDFPGVDQLHEFFP